MHNRVSFLHQLGDLLIAYVKLVVLEPVILACLLDVPLRFSIAAEYLGAQVVVYAYYFPAFARK